MPISILDDWDLTNMTFEALHEQVHLIYALIISSLLPHQYRNWISPTTISLVIFEPIVCRNHRSLPLSTNHEVRTWVSNFNWSMHITLHNGERLWCLWHCAIFICRGLETNKSFLTFGGATHRSWTIAMYLWLCGNGQRQGITWSPVWLSSEALLFR